MGFDEGHVTFDHPNLRYYSGETVHGKLEFDQTKLKTFRGLYVVMKGYCDVHWTTSHTRRHNDRTEHYTVNHNSHENYFEQKIYLMGGASGEVHLQPGHHVFPFQCLIPPHCPSSYEGSNGHIKYELKFVVDRSLKFDQEKKLNITVITPRDLNVEPYCREPITFQFCESYCSWCTSAGACNTVVKTKQAGFCPGSSVPIELGCENKSSVEIDTIKLEIKENITFRATTLPDTRHESRVIAKLKKGPVPGNTTRNWSVELDIPEMDLYNVDACQYIDIDYEFMVSIETSGCHSDSSDSARIVLGNIPLRDLEDNAPITNVPVAPSQQYPGYPYPLAGNAPYPAGNGAYPTVNAPYPAGNGAYPAGNNPYPPESGPYPAGNGPYPSVAPYPPVNTPYPPTNTAYPAGNSPYPVSMPTPGFAIPAEHNHAAKMPMLPSTMPMPYPVVMPQNPYATASAPEPSTPDFDAKQPMLDNNSPFNPEFKEKK